MPTCGCGSVGRASPCQGEGRGFESRHPLGSTGWTADRDSVGWPRGEAAACKAVYTGSNPVPTSGDWRRGSALPSHGRGHWFDPSIAHHQNINAKWQFRIFVKTNPCSHSTNWAISTNHLPVLLLKRIVGGIGKSGPSYCFKCSF